MHPRCKYSLLLFMKSFVNLQNAENSGRHSFKYFQWSCLDVMFLIFFISLVFSLVVVSIMSCFYRNNTHTYKSNKSTHIPFFFFLVERKISMCKIVVHRVRLHVQTENSLRSD